jgi:hypothetical protein
LKENLQNAQDTYAKYYDQHAKEPPVFQVGDKVWLNAKHLTTTRQSKKLDQKFVGPYDVVKKINDVAFELDLPPTLSIHPVFHVSLLSPFHEGHAGRAQAPPPATTVNVQEEFKPERIIDSREQNGRHEFLIKWTGFTEDHNEWKDYEEIKDLKILKAYARKHPDRPVPDQLRRKIRGRRSE